MLLRLLSMVQALVLVVAAGFPRSVAAEDKKVELNPIEFKAAFLSKIPPYVSWPASAFTNAEQRITVGILGEDPVGDILDQLFKDKKVNGRDIVVTMFKDTTQVPKCHVLFIPAAQKEQWQELSKTLDPTGLLTIGESDDFFKIGGVFSLSVETRKLKINLANAKKARLEINAKLLKIASVEK